MRTDPTQSAFLAHQQQAILRYLRQAQPATAEEAQQVVMGWIEAKAEAFRAAWERGELPTDDHPSAQERK
ncbi:MAG: hypothetical protein OEV94_02770 [Deltaproteobacteria bacterium]|nr:hypothetical protein [Deltaproteobacteria bacterium]